MTVKQLVRVLFWLLLLSQSVWPDTGLDERVRAITSELRCVVCQNLSVADSPSEMAVQMRAIVRQQLQQGKSPEEIKAYFVSKYGDWVLLAPPRTGFNLIVWVLPFLVLGAALLCTGWILYRWSRKRSVSSENDTADPNLLERVREELSSPESSKIDLDDPVSRAKKRVYADIRELEFDYYAGKLSESDYSSLRKRYENQAASILAQERRGDMRRASTQARDRVPDRSHVPPARRGSVLAGAAVLLVAGGVAIGLLLGQSLRPRISSEDSMTGDFLTGTDAGDRTPATSTQVEELLQRGQTAFEKKEFKNAIDSFKEVLRADPQNPVANAYMGLILAQAGHSDAALVALDRALSRAPDFPMALWVKGMILYRDKRDLAGAKKNLTALVALLPPGEQKEAIQGTIAEIEKDSASPTRAAAENGESTLKGTIVIDPKLEQEVLPRSVLFIIARRPGSKRGPPLAVKRVADPTFPFSFTLGAANVMIPGTPFDGPVDLLVRLDKDGNPMTREPGSLTGVYKKNPVPIGTGDIEITIDQTAGE